MLFYVIVWCVPDVLNSGLYVMVLLKTGT